MKTSIRGSWQVMATAAALSIGAIGCNPSIRYGDGGDQPGGPADLTFVFPPGSDDGGNPNPGSDGGKGGPSACGDTDPSCRDVQFAPASKLPFPLSTDMPIDPNESNDGVGRDTNGFLVLDSTHASFDYLWVANTQDIAGRGSVSKFNSKTVRESARYYSVTCYSQKTGTTQDCDGKNGCCANDSYPQFQNRRQKMPSGPAQQVQQMTNYPSRTAVDFNGDMWIANRAFGGQSSLSKIANDPSACIDRNKNGKIETSRDVNGDGVIQVDCNGNGTPDNIADVKATPCTNGMQQEFYGEDDECILFTTNTNETDKWGRPLTLGPGAQDFGPSDAWAGNYQDAKFFRIDGTTGITKDEADLDNASCMPYGAVVDSTGILWAGNLSGSPKPALCYFDTKNTMHVGVTRSPTVGQESGYGIALDRDQNIWNACLSFGACRYTPDRKNGFMGLGNGYWTMISQPGLNTGSQGFAIGMAVDDRSSVMGAPPNKYFAWIAGGQSVVRIPATDLALPNGADVLVNGAAYPSVQIAGDGKGVGVDKDQNVWNVAGSGTTGATRIKVDAMGTMTKPDINSPPMGNNLCPAGDHCAHQGNNPWDPSPYTYSDFTGFGLRNFTRSTGTWTYLVKGCVDPMGNPATTKWLSLKFAGDTPLNTTITIKARTGKTAMPDQTWGPWIPDQSSSPVDLVNGIILTPNWSQQTTDAGDYFLQVEVDLATKNRNKTPRLFSVEILVECPGTIG